MPMMGTEVWAEMKSRIWATASALVSSSKTTPWMRREESTSHRRTIRLRGLVSFSSTETGFTSSEKLRKAVGDKRALSGA